jgi:hypothetical protein
VLKYAGTLLGAFFERIETKLEMATHSAIAMIEDGVAVPLLQMARRRAAYRVSVVRSAFAPAMVAALWPCAALAIDGNELLSACETPGAPHCTRYIAGVADTLRGVPYFAICPPGATDYQHMVEVAVKKLRDHPEIRHYNAAHVVGIALRAAYPCEKSRGRSSRR